MSQDGDKPQDSNMSHCSALLDIFCKIDVVDEIQAENQIVLDVFDDIFTIAALFEIVRLNIKDHKGITRYFPQICADVFSCLPDRFVDDIGSNDYLMDLFFEIPQSSTDSRMASCFCQMIERFVSSVPYVLFTYLQLNSDSVSSLFLRHISLSSYLNSLRYLLDIPIYDDVCWWCNPEPFVDKMLVALGDKEASFNTKEFVLSIIQRATVAKKDDKERSSKRLLQCLLDDHHSKQLFQLLQQNLDGVICSYKALLRIPSSNWDEVSYLTQFVNSHMEIANNCFLILSRCFWKYSHGLTTGRGGYNSCFNTSPMPIQELMKLGGIKNRVLLKALAKQCKTSFPLLFTSISTFIRLHREWISKQAHPSFILSMAPKPVLGFCEFCYHFIHSRNDRSTLLFFMDNGFVDDLLSILDAYPNVTNIHVNIVDVLITMVYTDDVEILQTLVTKTNLLQVVYNHISNKSLSSVKSQLNIFLQAVASCCCVTNEMALTKKCISGKEFQAVMQMSPFFEQITTLVDIFRIYEPLVATSRIDNSQPILGTNRSGNCQPSGVTQQKEDGERKQDHFTIPV